MTLLEWIVTLAALAPAACAAGRDEAARLSELVVEVRSADYRGDRAALARLDGRARRARRRARWPSTATTGAGFARWRRALNGFNETPTPDDLGVRPRDRGRPLPGRRSSGGPTGSRRSSRWSAAGATSLYLAGDDADKQQGDPRRGRSRRSSGSRRTAGTIRGRSGSSGGMQFAAPPPVRAATSRRPRRRCGTGVALRLARGASRTPRLPGLGAVLGRAREPDEPRVHVLARRQGPIAPPRSPTPRAPLTAVPEWHYVRDILLPQIEALPVAVAAR